MSYNVITNCQSCQAPIRWVKTWKNGKAMPLDAEPVPDGNIVLIGGKSVVINPKTEDGPEHEGCTHPTHCRVPDMAHYKSHFATCPNSRSHRKAGG